MSAKSPEKARRRQLSHRTLLSATGVRETDPAGRPAAGEGAAQGRGGRRRPELSGLLFRGHCARRGRLGGTRWAFSRRNSYIPTGMVELLF